MAEKGENKTFSRGFTAFDIGDEELLIGELEKTIKYDMNPTREAAKKVFRHCPKISVAEYFVEIRITKKEPS